MDVIQDEVLGYRVPWSTATGYLLKRTWRVITRVLFIALLLYLMIASSFARFVWVPGHGVELISNNTFNVRPGSVIVYDAQGDSLMNNPFAPTWKAITPFRDVRIGRVLAGPYGPIEQAKGKVVMEVEGGRVEVPWAREYGDVASKKFLDEELIVACIPPAGSASGQCETPYLAMSQRGVLGVIDEAQREAIRGILPWAK